MGSSSAGLTVAASREGGEWHLEAGALVLADGGLCCIDEFGSIREQDRACIHEAMEQQSLSVAKAGMVCKLQTRCKVLAACNPKGQYDPALSLSLNTAIASPLLSRCYSCRYLSCSFRFDLVLVLLDRRDPAWDRLVSSHLLQGRSLVPQEQENGGKQERTWSLEKLRSYFSYIQQFKPSLSPSAGQVLTQYYRRQRTTDGAEVARTTVRLLQSCVRLAQGHARLMCRREAGLQDALVAVFLLESSAASSSSLTGSSSPLRSCFPENPVEDYR